MTKAEHRAVDDADSVTAFTASAESDPVYARLIQASSIPVLLLAASGETRYCNAAFRNLTGYSRDEIPTIDAWWLLACPEAEYRRWASSSWSAAIGKARGADGKIDAAMYRITCKNGDSRFLETSGAVAGDSCLISFRDLTESKNTADALDRHLLDLFLTASDLSDRANRNLEQARLIAEKDTVDRQVLQNERRFRRLFELVQVPLALIDRKGKLLFLNERFVRCFGYSVDDIPTVADWHRRAYPDEAGRALAASTWAEVMLASRESGKEIGPFDRTILDKSGARHILEVTGNPFEDDILVTCLDVTEQRQSAGAFRKINECIAGLGLSFQENVDRITGLFGELSRADSTMYSRLEGDMLCTIGCWNGPPDLERVSKAEGHICHDVILKGGNQPFILRDLQHSIYAELNPDLRVSGLQTYIGKAIFCEGAYIGSLCAVFRSDVASTAEIEQIISVLASALGAEETRNRALKRLEDSNTHIRELNASLEKRVEDRTVRLTAINRELESFSFSVSHDLRAPLRAIDGFSDILENDYGPQFDDEGRRLIGVIRRSTRRMNDLIMDLLSLSRISSREMTIQRLDMELLARAIFSEVLQTAGVADFSFDIGRLPPVDGDLGLIRQAWTNLFSNAVKYSIPCAVHRICVDSEIQEGMNVYHVRDSGVGFNEAYAGKLFTPFQRLHNAGQFDGTGVGLAIVQRIISRHGGRVWAHAQEGMGATFSFALPPPLEREAGF